MTKMKNFIKSVLTWRFIVLNFLKVRVSADKSCSVLNCSVKGMFMGGGKNR